ncbi:MAG: TlpA family protein disulfide reductase [Acidobacteria bacterium]|jgi:peroxiredoxin|nr:TlpA family protein disulfide reductase [Acidobacteriota bacterium]
MLVSLMLVLGVALSRSSSQQDPESRNQLPGKQAPNFTLTSLDGKKVTLADLRGKAVLLNFWATWCQPCKIEMPWFVDLQKRYGAQGLQIVGVAMDDASPEDIAGFAKELGVNYLVLTGKDEERDKVSAAYGGVQFLPETFYIDRSGKVSDRVFGLKGRSEIEDSVKKILASQPAEEHAEVR